MDMMKEEKEADKSHQKFTYKSFSERAVNCGLSKTKSNNRNLI